ncbi:MAG: ribonuclease Y [Leptospirillia bacterium]
MDPTTLLGGVLVLVTGALIFSVMRKPAGRNPSETESLARKIIENAEHEAAMLRKSVELELKEEQISARSGIDDLTRDRQEQVLEMEKRLLAREARIDTQTEDLTRREALLNDQEAQLEKAREQVEESGRQLVAELEKLGGLSAEDARAKLVIRIEGDARFEAAKALRRIEDDTLAEAEEHARHIISTAIQRLAGDYVVEATISVVNLPSDDMKGRIIGREGRNIRALESATGVNLIVDDTPETILLSSFDPLRREVARLSIERLMADGRFHPSRIEETVRSVEQKLDQEMREEASRIVFELDVHDLHEDIIGLLGKLKYRLSYGQNNLSHAREVALLCGLMADELGLDRKLAVRGGLLHDIGKVLTQEMEGGHATIGGDFAARCGEHPDVVNAIAAHHGDVKPTTKEAYLVAAGDALSAGRPGARRENMEFHVKRLADLEAVAGAFPGVDRAYAMQAGREVRVLVDAETVGDDECSLISRDIAEKIEKELNYPGQIKICLVRESRFVEYAR